VPWFRRAVGVKGQSGSDPRRYAPRLGRTVAGLPVRLGFLLARPAAQFWFQRFSFQDFSFFLWPSPSRHLHLVGDRRERRTRSRAPSIGTVPKQPLPDSAVCARCTRCRIRFADYADRSRSFRRSQTAETVTKAVVPKNPKAARLHHGPATAIARDASHGQRHSISRETDQPSCRGVAKA
jgi:hypothetical protein